MIHELADDHKEHLRVLGVAHIPDQLDIPDDEYEEHAAAWRRTLPDAGDDAIHTKVLGHHASKQHSRIFEGIPPTHLADSKTIEDAKNKEIMAARADVWKMSEVHFPALKKELDDIEEAVEAGNGEIREARTEIGASIAAAAGTIVGALNMNHAGVEKIAEDIRLDRAEDRQLLKQFGWGILALLFLLIVATLFAPRAHGQFSKINNIQFQQNGADISGGFYSYPFAINCTVNVTCTVVGGVLTINSSGGGSGSPGGALTSIQYNNAGAFGGFGTFNGTNVDFTGYRVIASEYDSDSALLADNGTIRLNKLDFLAWRNNANSGNINLSLDTSNRVASSGGFAGALTGNVTGNVTGALTGNADTATTLATTRAIYGNNFNGSAALTQIIASGFGGTGNGFTKFSGATTSEKTYSLPDATTTILTTNAAVTVGQGGTGQSTTATSGRYLKGDGSNWGTSTGSASGVGTPTACTNQFVTGFTLNSDAAPTSTCTTDVLASAQHANQGTTTTVLHGNGAGNPSFAAVDVSTAEITGVLKAAAFPALTGDLTTSSGALATTLATKYKTAICTDGLGDGLNAITAGTYIEVNCYNDFGATYTITGIKCFTDNNGSSTLNAANDAATALLTGAVTCTNSWAAGTQSGTTTIASAHWIKFTFVADGTTKNATFAVTLTR